jgi:hypothetical protein
MMASPQNDFAMELWKLRDLSQTIQRLGSPPSNSDSTYALGEILAAHEALNTVLVCLVKGADRPADALGSSTSSEPPQVSPQAPFRNPLQAYFLDPILNLVNMSGEEPTATARESVHVSVSQPSRFNDSDAVSRSTVTKSGPTVNILQHLEACLPLRSASGWLERDPELRRNVRWLETKLKAIEVLALEDEDATPDEDIVRELNAATESLMNIIAWHHDLAQEEGP